MRRWDEGEQFKPSFRTPGNHRRYDLQRVRGFKNERDASHRETRCDEREDDAIRVALYTRVSTSKQKKRGDLDRQEDRLRQHCKENGHVISGTFKDVGSGLNDSRAGLHQLIKFASHGKCDLVLVSYSDRLARFGTRVLKTCFSTFGVDLRFLGKKGVVDSKEAELVNDITAILYSYMGKLYRMRRGRQEKGGVGQEDGVLKEGLIS